MAERERSGAPGKIQGLAEIRPFEVEDAGGEYVILEMIGGDNSLDSHVQKDLEEMTAGAPGCVTTLALADRLDNEAVVYEVSPRVGVRVVEEWGEIDTGDPEVLCEFMTRALVTYRDVPHVAIGFWNHGHGVFEEDDPDENLMEGGPAHFEGVPGRRRGAQVQSMLDDETDGGKLTNREARRMLEEAFREAGRTRPVDLLFSDTCLNGMVEILHELGSFAEVVIGSPEVEPEEGWGYDSWFQAMASDPPGTAEEWARQAVLAYGVTYEDRPRAHPCTLGAFRSVNGITEAFRGLVEELRGRGEEGFHRIREVTREAQSFAYLDSLDLVDVAEKVREHFGDEAVAKTASRLVEATRRACVEEVHLGRWVQGSHGLGFWFPRSRRSFARDREGYATLRFARDSGWLEYLSEHL